MLNGLKPGPIINFAFKAERERPSIVDSAVNSIRLRWLALLGLVWVTVSGCVRSHSVQSTRPSVGRVDCSNAPEMAGHAERLRGIGDQFYPAIRELLKDGSRHAPRSFDIILTNEPGGNVGQTIGSRVYLNAHYVSTATAPDRLFQSPAGLEAVLVHEMTHVVQQYDATAPAYWAEGMADYVCSKLGYTNALNCLRCSAEYPHYLSGYQCAGAFLHFVETRYASNAIPELHRNLRRGSYTESFFLKLSGKGLEQLWSEFQETPAFTSAAKEVLALQEALGFVNGKPPADVVHRAEAYFKLPSGSVTNAIASLVALRNAGRLPGFSSSERGSVTLSSAAFGPGNIAYPLTLTLRVRKAADSALYSFTFEQSSEDTSWQLQNATRLSPDHRIVEKLSVPHLPP